MSLYDDLQKVTQDILSEFKQGLIEYGALISGDGPNDDPGPSILQYMTLNGAVARGVQTRYVQSGLAVSSDIQVTMSVQTGVTPAQKDFVKIDGVRYKVQEVIKKPAAGTVVAFTLILRR
jgi:hypothetical protein